MGFILVDQVVIVKAIFAFLLLYILQCFTAFASSTPSAWQVSKVGGPNIWLLGSIHYGKADIYPLPQAVISAFNKSDNLVVEIDISRISQQDIYNTRELTHLPQGKTLQQVLPKSSFDSLSAQLRQVGLDSPKTMQLQPWFALISAFQLKLHQLGYSPIFGIDNYFIKQANQQGKPIKQLESMHKQFWYLSELAKSTPDYLETSLRQFDDAEITIDKAIAAWRQGRDKALQRLLLDMEGKSIDAKIQQLLLTERNLDWMEQIHQFDSKQSYFIVVGALHLTGEHGLVNLLKQQGFQIQSLKN